MSIPGGNFADLLFFQNKDLSMIIILPDDPNGLSDLVKGLVKHKIGDIRKTGKKTDVEILLPKFKIESELSFKESLRKVTFASTASAKTQLFGSFWNEIFFIL